MHFCAQENSFVADLVKLKHAIKIVIAGNKGGVVVGVVSPPTSAAQF